MGQKIWGVLEDYAGRWVAVDPKGEVVAQAPSLSDLVRSVGETARHLTLLYASEGEAVRS